jgi:hypothetical protein
MDWLVECVGLVEATAAPWELQGNGVNASQSKRKPRALTLAGTKGCAVKPVC